MEIALKVIKYAFMILPAVLGFHTWLYSKYPKYYFFVVRIFSKWRDTTWSITADYRIREIGDIYIKIERVLKDRFKGGYRRSVNMTDKKLYECGIYNILIQDDFNAGEFSERKLYIRISQLNVTLKTAEDKLRELRELFNELQLVIFPEDKGYVFEVHFKSGNNPFFGLMVQRLGKENVAHFECFFPLNAIVKSGNENDTNKQFLRVYKEKLCINESSFDIVERTAKRALLFK